MEKFHINDLHFNPDDCKWEEVESWYDCKQFNVTEMEKQGWNSLNGCWTYSSNIPDNISDIAGKLFKKYQLSILKQPSGNSMPIHTDSYRRFRKLYDPEDKRNSKPVIRLIVFLKDWESGHYLEYNYEPITKWKKGDAYMIKTGVTHLSGNMGNTPKYTMQLTGFKEDFNERAL